MWWHKELINYLRESNYEIKNEESIHYIHVLICTECLNKTEYILDSTWRHTGDRDWMFRVDPEDPAIPLQRHVHIARKKYTASKTNQVSWNKDGSRHDKNTFNESLGKQKAVREIAARVLKLNNTSVLDSSTQASNKVYFLSKSEAKVIISL